jgi:hypothetical protein
MVQTRASKRKRNLIWSAVLVLSIISSLVAPVLVIAWIVLGFIFGGAKNHDDWLERV